MKWLQAYLGEDASLFYSYIIFSDRCTLKDIHLTSGHHHVINRYNILPAVRKNVSSAGTVLSKEKIDVIYEKLTPLTQMDEVQKMAHIENITRAHPKLNSSKNLDDSDKVICPVCGGKLVLRTATKGKRTGERFWGCSNYPRCRYIKNIGNDNGKI